MKVCHPNYNKQWSLHFPGGVVRKHSVPTHEITGYLNYFNFDNQDYGLLKEPRARVSNIVTKKISTRVFFMLMVPKLVYPFPIRPEQEPIHRASPHTQ